MPCDNQISASRIVIVQGRGVEAGVGVTRHGALQHEAGRHGAIRDVAH